MLYTCVNDFFSQVDKLKQAEKLTRDEEKELARKMKDGDEDAKQKLKDTYLPVLASYLTRYINDPSLDLVYRGMAVLETSILTFDFQYDGQSPNSTFAHYLVNRIKPMVMRYIADRP